MAVLFVMPCRSCVTTPSAFDTTVANILRGLLLWVVFQQSSFRETQAPLTYGAFIRARRLSQTRFSTAVDLARRVGAVSLPMIYLRKKQRKNVVSSRWSSTDGNSILPNRLFSHSSLILAVKGRATRSFFGP